MKAFYFLVLATFLCLSLNPETVSAGKKKKKSKKSSPPDDTKMFDPKTLKCLVCQNLVKEFDAEIFKIDPKKMVDTGTFRINEKGNQQRQIVPYARSQMHLLELTENICKNFEDYAQAKTKRAGKPTIIRITTPDGNMNPEFGMVDIVPDENLNTRLKFHCETVVEEMDEHFLELLADEANTSTIIGQKICVEEGAYCKNLKDEL